MKDESLVARILAAVVKTSSVPVTLKTRTGWDRQYRNAPTIARIAEDCGIQALTIHGRTRACRFAGEAEYDTIAEVVEQVSIPVFANGDIEDAEHAARVLAQTGAAGVMIGRGAQGQPWLFDQIRYRLETGDTPDAPPPEKSWMHRQPCPQNPRPLPGRSCAGPDTKTCGPLPAAAAVFPRITQNL